MSLVERLPDDYRRPTSGLETLTGAARAARWRDLGFVDGWNWMVDNNMKWSGGSFDFQVFRDAVRLEEDFRERTRRDSPGSFFAFTPYCEGYQKGIEGAARQARRGGG